MFVKSIDKAQHNADSTEDIGNCKGFPQGRLGRKVAVTNRGQRTQLKIKTIEKFPTFNKMENKGTGR